LRQTLCASCRAPVCRVWEKVVIKPETPHIRTPEPHNLRADVGPWGSLLHAAELCARAEVLRTHGPGEDSQFIATSSLAERVLSAKAQIPTRMTMRVAIPIRRRVESWSAKGKRGGWPRERQFTTDGQMRGIPFVCWAVHRILTLGGAAPQTERRSTA
jgi:hypothetical protein